MNTEKIKKEIATLERTTANPAVPNDLKEQMKTTLQQLKNSLEKGSSPAPATEKKAKKEVKEAKEEVAEGKKPVAKKSKSSKKKSGSANESPSCDELMEKWEERKKQARINAGKAKTKSIFDKVTDKIEGAVVAAVKNIPAEEIKEDPKKKLKQIDELSDSAVDFVGKFKAVMGDEFEKSGADKAFTDLHKLIESLKKKYAGK